MCDLCHGYGFLPSPENPVRQVCCPRCWPAGRPMPIRAGSLAARGYDLADTIDTAFDTPLIEPPTHVRRATWTRGGALRKLRNPRQEPRRA